MFIIFLHNDFDMHVSIRPDAECMFRAAAILFP
jgi:hypothetical protein